MINRKQWMILWIIILFSPIVLVNACNGPSGSPVEITPEKKAKIREVMDRICKNGQFSGAMLVAVNGEVIYSRAHGYANLEWKVPNTLDTKFRIASASKPFTAMLILKLMDEGKLTLDGKLTDYLPEFPGEKGDAITVHQLLTHTSGVMGEPRLSDLEDIERLYYTRERLFQYICEKELVYPPGNGREYSNFGYFLLGMIIEKVSGKPYGQLLQEKICGPAGMKNTIPDVNVPLIEKRASGYDHDYIEGLKNSTFLDMSFVFGYGHLLSTVEDLFLFDKALYTDQLLSKQSRALFFLRYGWLPFRYPYGKNNKRILSNNLDGSVNGFGSHIFRIEKDRIFITILRNMKERNNQIFVKWPSYITSRVLAILFDEEYDMPRISGAYTVFRAFLESGVQAGTETYHDLDANQKNQYYFNEDEFHTLGQTLYDAGKLKEALAYYMLIPNNRNAIEMIKKLEEEIK